MTPNFFVLWLKDFLILTHGFYSAGDGVEFRIGVFDASGCTDVRRAVHGAKVSVQIQHPLHDARNHTEDLMSCCVFSEYSISVHIQHPLHCLLTTDAVAICYLTPTGSQKYFWENEFRSEFDRPDHFWPNHLLRNRTREVYRKAAKTYL